MTGKMRIMNRSGDTAVAWDTEDKASVEEVEKEFARLKGQNFLAFAIAGAQGSRKGEQIDTLDPKQHQEVMMVPSFIGG